MHVVSQKLIFLGLDGATWTQLDKFLQEDLMPNLSAMIKNGVKAELRSTFPYTSRTSWISMLTGTNPGKHGIPHHIVGGKQEVPSIWKILSDHNVKSIIVNDIVTYPPLQINGIMISGGFSTPPHSKDFVHPISLFEEINSLVDGYIPSLDSTIMEKLQNGMFEDAFFQLQEYGSKIVKTSLYLANKFNWEIISIVLENTDYLHHFFWDKPEFLKRFYKWLDEVLGNFHTLSLSYNANFLIVSDHGFGHIEKHFLINSWLRDSGLANFGKPGEIRRYLSKTKIKRDFVRKNLSRLHLRRLASKFTPSEIKKMIPLEQNEDGYIQDSTDVYSEAYNEITINVDDPLKYEQIRNDVIKKLLQLHDNGKKVIQAAHKREEVFHGPYVNRAYDVQILTTLGYCWSSSIKEKYLLTTDEFGKTRTGDHRPEGIFLALGPDIKKGTRLEKSLMIWDICPTVLHMLNQEIPSYMDGKVISTIFDSKSSLHGKQISFQKENEKEFLRKRISQKRDLLNL